MNDTTVKQSIRNAIQGFNLQDLTTASLQLFNTLGYNTDRQDPFSQKSFRYFKDNFLDGQTRFDEGKALSKEWNYVDLLFQLSGHELSKQASLFDSKKVITAGNTKIAMESYLFFTIGIIGSGYSRTAFSQITREVNRLFPMPVMILFKTGNTLTLSVINRRLHKRDESKDVLEKVTLIKDIRIENPHRAHIEILFDLSFPELLSKHKFSNFVELHNAWQKTLDTKELNKRFYQDLSYWYFWAMEHVSFPDDIEKSREIRNSTSLIRLITRIIFIWFLKEKGLVPETLFEPKELSRILKDFVGSKTSHSYYHAILQNLFFGTLNQKMDERGFAKEGSIQQNKSTYGIKNLFRYTDCFAVSPQDAITLFNDIPFLNGGLFDCLDKEDEDGKVLYSDGFSRNPKKQAIVPDFLFFAKEQEVDLNAVYGTKNKHYKVKGLIDILSGYKFTVAENTPVEEEVALDPELLGKVFENLLASYNPETQTTARRQTGSFYTPREIVNYMVDESLKAYFKQALSDKTGIKTEDAEAGLELLFSYTEKEHAFTRDETSALIEAIDACKILDPACGSGAFPMGILHKLVHILHKLDPKNKQWKKRQIKKAHHMDDPAIRGKLIADIESAFESNELDYGRKLYLIENCIYGVDIQPIAVQIAKLRFFISLVVEQSRQSGVENLGIRSLPNLETKFVAANTLIGLDKPKQMAIQNPRIKDLEDELKGLRHKYFSAKTRREKLICQRKDKDLRKRISTLLIKDGWDNKSAKQVADFDPYDQNIGSPFFDPEWMFGVKDGFDVVIGNPPYLESRHPSFSDHLKASYQKSCQNRWGNDAHLITKGADLLIYFFEASISFIKRNGNIVLITQNAWLDTEYGIKAQKFLTKHTNVKSIIDSKYRYFPAGEGPNINTVITIFVGKERNPFNNIRFYTLKENIEHFSLNSKTKTNTENDKYKMNLFSYSDRLITKYKWGILHNSDAFILDILALLEEKAVTIDKIPSKIKYSFGQGLNLKKSFFVPSKVLTDHNIELENCFPIVYSGAPFQIKQTDWYLVRKNRIKKQQLKNLHAGGFIAFDEKTTRKKPPVLIMPRGISRHFCGLNLISAYSLSGVDVYADTYDGIGGEVLNLWCFFNSSIFWLLREISGRKNLGGGLLKSEAADLISFPVYLSMDLKKREITSLLDREALDTLNEITSDEHKIIDKIIFDYLGVDNIFREKCIEYLRNVIIFRSKRSVT